MNPDSPFTVHGDETLEARIVAWVLGEASAFEEAELERLCQERPELLVFRHRMRALHGLLTEAEKQQPDEGWKLPAEKRKVLDEIFGDTKVVRLEAEKENRVRHTGRKILLAIAASVVLGFVILSLVPEKYESTASFEIKPRFPGMSPLSANYSELSGARAMTPQFFGTEFEIIKSRNCLEKVVDNLNLQSRWKVDKETAVNKLKGMVDASNVKGTDLINIRVRDSKPDDVRDIAQEVARSYKQYREGLERKAEESQLASLRKAVQAQEDKVEERRKVLSTIVRSKGIIYKGDDALAAGDQGAKNALQMYHQTEQEKIQLESQINSLLKYDNDQLMTYASGLDLPDNTVKNLYPQYLEAKRQLEAQKINGQGDKHPSVVAAEDSVQQMKKQLDEGVVNLRDTLKAKLELTSDRFKTLTAMKDETRDDAIKRGLDAQDYVDAKRDFENDQELLQQMKLKLIGEDTSAEMQLESVRIHEEAVAARKVGPLQSLFGLFGNREPQPNAELADAKTVRFSTSAAASAPAPAQLESAGRMAKRSSDGSNAKMVPLRPEFPAELIEGTPKPIILPPIADAPAEANLAMQPQAMEPAASAKNFDRPAEKSELAGRLDVATGTVLPKGEAVDRKIAASAAGGATLESKPQAGESLGLVVGGKAQNPAKPASQPLPQSATAAPADGDMDLAKLMSSGGARGGIFQEEFKTYAGKVMPSQPENLQAGNAEVTSNFFSGKAAENEIDPYADVKPMPNLSTSPQSPADGQSVSNGLRSGDFATSRNSIDAILSGTGDRSRAAADEKESPAQPMGGLKRDLSLADAEGTRSKGDQGGLAEREMIRRQNAASEENKLLADGRDAYAKGDYQAALSKFDKSLEMLPDASVFEKQKESLQAHRDEAALALARQNREVGKYEEAKRLIEEVAKNDPSNAEAKKELDFLNDPIRSDAAETMARSQSPDAVRKNLYIAEGNYNLGKYDDAKKAYEDVLRADPYNSAARRGMERLAQTKADYYRAAYDHTRQELLAQVDAAWEVAVPAEKGAKDGDLEGIDKNGVVQEGEKKAQIQRELQYPTEYEAPELPNAESKTKDFPVTPATPDGFKTKEAASRAPVNKPQPAKPDLSKLIEEIASADEPYSTFSLNISDASFQIAQAAMAKGERPDPAGVKVEQFYNAVDYGDPAPGAGEPVAVNIEQSAHPVIPGRNLVRVALKTAAAGRAASQPLHLTLLVDQSGSMSREDRRTAMKQALGSLGGLLSNNDSVTVVGFSRTPHLLADGLSGDQSKKLPDLINVEASEGGTNLEEAMKLGEQLAQRHKQAGAQNRIVLFTDGAANLGNADPEKLAERVKQLRQKGIALDIAGIAAADLNDELLAELARNGNGRYYVVGKGNDDNFAKQLAGAFRPAAENVKVQVHFNPERVSRYKLIGFEKDRLKTEDFRNDAVDAAEMAAEEAGVAIYQIEPIPNGKGEIGEVSVRFRDTAAGQMVERTWTISHDPATPSFDRAAPSMQLATFAMLAAEKLKGGAFSEAIDFKQLSGPQANVKHFYGEQGRPAEVLHMVDMLK